MSTYGFFVFHAALDGKIFSSLFSILNKKLQYIQCIQMRCNLAYCKGINIEIYLTTSVTSSNGAISIRLGDMDCNDAALCYAMLTANWLWR